MKLFKKITGFVIIAIITWFVIIFIAGIIGILVEKPQNGKPYEYSNINQQSQCINGYIILPNGAQLINSEGGGVQCH